MEYAKLIGKSKKKTEVTVYLHEPIDNCYEYVAIGEWESIQMQLKKHQIQDYQLVCTHRNSAMNLLEIHELDVRIEPGAIIREHVELQSHCIILMGAILNTGCIIGENTMIDMGAVIGSGARIGSDCHIGANAVIAGILEPRSKDPVIIDKNVLIGANAVILEGVHIHSNSIIGAGSIVLEDVPQNCVFAGNPARFIKFKDDKTIQKTELDDILRNI